VVTPECRWRPRLPVPFDGNLSTGLRRSRPALGCAGQAGEGGAALEEGKRTFANPYKAAEMGYIDDVIEPHETRPRLVSALLAARNKREPRPARKHGNIPL